MSMLPISFAPAALALFLAVLALVPLAIMWLDGRRREEQRAHIARLQEQARLNHRLRQPERGLPAGLRVPGE